MKHFETREAARILDLAEGRIRSCVRAGFLSPGRGPGRRYRFTFQDLLLLKTTKGLLESGVPPGRVARLMGSLKRQLPEERKLSSVTIYADGRRVVAWDGSARWEPASGQFLFNFDAAEVASRAAIEIGDAEPAVTLEPSTTRTAAAKRKGRPGAPPAATGRRRQAARSGAPTSILVEQPAGRSDTAPRARGASPSGTIPGSHRPTAEEWYDLACELEEDSELEARRAYAKALELDPRLADAHVNLGRLHHEAGELDEAEAHYRTAAKYAPEDPVVWFDLGVLREDQGSPEEALLCYRRAIENDPIYLDAHYNLGLLYESLGRRAEAMNHYMKARRLMGRG